MTGMSDAPYRSPFRPYDHPHESNDPVCLSRLHHDDPARGTWLECYEAAVLLCDSSDQFALWGARHLTELGLKLLAGRSNITHDLGRLLSALPAEVAAVLKESGIVHFIQDLQRIDPKGDACRYGFDTGGRATLAAVCCIDRSDLRLYIQGFFDQVESLLPPAVIKVGEVVRCSSVTDEC